MKGNLEALLFSGDSQLAATIAAACNKTGLGLTTCSGVEQATAVLERRKVHAVLVDDADASSGAYVANLIEKSPSNRNTVSIVFVGKSLHSFRATFLVPKPVSLEVALRSLRAAEGPMLRDFLQYCRHPLTVAIQVSTDRGELLQADGINVSQSGLAVRLAEARQLALNGAVAASFVPPTSAATCIQLRGRVAWSDAQGRAGFYCHGATQSDQKRFEEWLVTLPAKPDRIAAGEPSRFGSL